MSFSRFLTALRRANPHTVWHTSPYDGEQSPDNAQLKSCKHYSC